MDVCIDRIYCHALDDASNTSGHDQSVWMTLIPILICRVGSVARGSVACGPCLHFVRPADA